MLKRDNTAVLSEIQTYTILNILMVYYTSVYILYFDSDGASKSGLFTSIWCILERIKSDREVAIADSVRMIRLRRQQTITGVVSPN